MVGDGALSREQFSFAACGVCRWILGQRPWLNQIPVELSCRNHGHGGQDCLCYHRAWLSSRSQMDSYNSISTENMGEEILMGKPFTVKLIGNSIWVIVKNQRCVIMLVHLRSPSLHLFFLVKLSVQACNITSINTPRISWSDLLATLKRFSNFDFLSHALDGAACEGAGEERPGEEGAGEEGTEALVPVSRPVEDAWEAVRRHLRLIVDGYKGK